MKIVPVVYVKDKKIRAKKDGEAISIKDILEQVKADEEIYILDDDGIEENKPEFSIYQALSEHYNIWADAGPRILDDVVDVVMGGATIVVIREKLFLAEDLPDVKEFTDCLIYSYVDLQKDEKHVLSMSPYVDGLVICNDRSQFENDFKFCELLKNLCKKHSIYVFEWDKENIKYWESFGVAGVLLYLEKQVKSDG
jgi:uncharacterized protein related to proFAR isomerase